MGFVSVLIRLLFVLFLDDSFFFFGSLLLRCFLLGKVSEFKIRFFISLLEVKNGNEFLFFIGLGRLKNVGFVFLLMLRKNVLVELLLNRLFFIMNIFMIKGLISKGM